MKSFPQGIIALSLGLTAVPAFSEIDSNRYEIQDVKLSMPIREDSTYPIYANGRMQAPVDIALKIYDKETSEYVQLTENQLKDSIRLTTAQGTPLIKEGQANASWNYTFTENQYAHRITSRLARSPDIQPSLGSEWSNTRAYVYTDIELYEQKICINIQNHDAIMFSSCNDTYDEFIRIESIAEKTYTAEYFNLSQVKLWDSTTAPELAGLSLNQQFYQHYIFHRQGVNLVSIGRIVSENGAT